MRASIPISRVGVSNKGQVCQMLHAWYTIAKLQRHISRLCVRVEHKVGGAFMWGPGGNDADCTALSRNRVAQHVLRVSVRKEPPPVCTTPASTDRRREVPKPFGETIHPTDKVKGLDGILSRGTRLADLLMFLPRLPLTIAIAVPGVFPFTAGAPFARPRLPAERAARPEEATPFPFGNHGGCNTSRNDLIGEGIDRL